MRRREMLQQGRLPAEYQEVEWIGSLGTQYLDTAVVPAVDDEIDIRYELTYTQSNTFVFGAKPYYVTSGSVQNQFFQIYCSGTTQTAEIGNAKCLFGQTAAYDYEMHADSDSITASAQSVTGVQATSYVNRITDVICLFARTGGDRASKVKIKEFKLKRNGVYILDLIPCYRKSDNVIGMCNACNGEFLTNAGTGTFTKGADVL